MLTEEFWDLYAMAYDLGTATLSGYRQLQAQVLKRLVDPGSGAVIDAGCGTFNYGVAVIDSHPRANVFGLEYNSTMAAHAQAKASARGGYVHHADVLEPWPLTGAAAVLSINVLYTLASPATFVSNAAAALEQGGQLLLVNPTNPSVQAIVEGHAHWLEHIASEQEREADAKIVWARDVCEVLNKHIAAAARGRNIYVANTAALRELLFEHFEVVEAVEGVYNGTCVLVDARKR